jgi:hypothetical protein
MLLQANNDRIQRTPFLNYPSFRAFRLLMGFLMLAHVFGMIYLTIGLREVIVLDTLDAQLLLATIH